MLTKDEIYLAVIQGAASGVGWAVGSIIILLIFEHWIKNYFTGRFDKIEEIINRVKK